MTLRSKILLAQLPLAAALAIVGGAGALVVSSLEENSDVVLRDNYESVLAAQRMRGALDEIEEGAARRQEGEATFERALRREEANITEPGEDRMVRELRATWRKHRQEQATVPATILELRRGVEQITTINQDAMVRKNRRATRKADSAYRMLVAAAIGISLLGLLASAALTARMIRPVGVLGQAVRRLGQGDLKARAQVDARDEIGQLARDFNVMADRLEQYRSSSLGELLVAQRESQAVIDSLSDPVIVTGIRGNVINVNPAAEHLVLVKLEEPDPLAGVDPVVRSALERVRAHVLAGKGPFAPKGLDEALRVLTHDGERSFLPRATPLYSEEGTIVGATIVLQDVTRLLRFDELRNDLVATVAHEFRTPLTSLRMALHMCTQGTVGPLNEKQADLLFAARDDCERLQGIVEDLLDLSRIQAGRIELHPREVSAETLVQEALDAHRAAAEEKGLTLRSEVLPGAGVVLADPDRLKLVFANLISNAIRHTPAGGEVVVAAQPADHAVRFEVRDTGSGIPPEHRGAIFEKFYRVPGAPSGGAGLGLYIAREIVQAHEGEIGFESEVGRGTTFWCKIPAAP